jgi:23S rRNA pseudouridine1911/1915/1917 synthase
MSDISGLSSRILYLDDNCIVINKLCGEALEGAGKGMGDLPRMAGQFLSLNEKGAQAGGLSARLPIPVAVHRLDVPVTGCALLARTQSALAFLNAAFAENATAQAGIAQPGGIQAVEKHYWAIVEKPQKDIPPAARLVHWILFDSKKNKSYAFDEPGPGRKKAVLEYRLAGAGENYLFLDIELITGRHHQIRCQFEKNGLHIKGDLKYGARRSEKHGGIRLHARSLAFPNPQPAISSRLSVVADPPCQDALWQAFKEAATGP